MSFKEFLTHSEDVDRVNRSLYLFFLCLYVLKLVLIGTSMLIKRFSKFSTTVLFLMLMKYLCILENKVYNTWF